MPIAGGVFPWESRDKQYWKKERVDLALLQIAARNQQRMIWSGEKEVLDLTAGNILVFMSLCQYIWAAWLRSFPEKALPRPSRHEIPHDLDPYIQDEGIYQASRHWYSKIRSDEGGDSRARFVTYLGDYFRKALRSDKKMSYPGHNGFSLQERELKDDAEVERYLNDAAAFGVLVSRRHTSRSKTRAMSYKWYLHPIFSPVFQLSVVHTKEPLEVHPQDVREWLEKADVFHTDKELDVTSAGTTPPKNDNFPKRGARRVADAQQRTLFDLQQE